jgi:putative FmdB family regulatory protein
MPIYEYQCDECEEKFEKLVRSGNGAATDTSCPKCGSKKIHKALSLFGFGMGAAGGRNDSSAGSSCGST